MSKSATYLNGVLLRLEDTRTTEEAHAENLNRARETITKKIIEAGYDEIWQRNAALGIISDEEAKSGREYISSLRSAYAAYKAKLFASNRDEADKIQLLISEK